MNSRIHAGLSNAAYGAPKRDEKGVLQRVHIGDQEFLPLKHMDTSSGYQGTIYKNVKTGDYVVAHRGTEFDRELLKDGVVDVGMVTGKLNAQLHDALELTRLAKEMAERDHKPLTVTGHSLGGALAQITAHHYNLPGEAFNPYGAAGLGYRIQEGQPAHAARFTNHVMAGDFVSAASEHYGNVQIYALPSELSQLRAADNMAALGGPAKSAALFGLTPVLAVQMADSHRLKHFLDDPTTVPPRVSVLGQESARITQPEDQARVDAFRENMALQRDAITRLSRGIPGLAVEGIDKLRGHDEPGAFGERQARAAELAAHPFNPAEHREAPGSDGGPRRENPAFHSRSPLEDRLNEMLNADPDRFKVLNQQMSTLNAGQALDQQAQS
ncbi:hemolysin [Stenotrophomonas sp. S41]|uniref:lipase family protein n=1 Tax=Stenotrophomonas sp. S41 TaxID=2767464 RepID=UPI00190C1634|nr:hemolysin [Stenotrophomonas sp. S41]MBK0011062.1 hemolysin [Stenotrophomonas sp. S41]